MRHSYSRQNKAVSSSENRNLSLYYSHRPREEAASRRGDPGLFIVVLIATGLHRAVGACLLIPQADGNDDTFSSHIAI